MNFKALYKDGTLYEQGDEDKSVQEEGKNAFYDIYYKPFKPLEDLVTFSIGDWSVNLQDGHFEHSGQPFVTHEFKHFDPKTARLIYWVQKRIDFTPDEDLSKKKGITTGYILGWQCTVERKNYQHTITINS